MATCKVTINNTTFTRDELAVEAAAGTLRPRVESAVRQALGKEQKAALARAKKIKRLAPDVMGVDAAEAEYQRSKRPTRDLMEFRLASDTDDVVRGAAILIDKATDKWRVRWFSPEGSMKEGTITGASRVEAWFEGRASTVDGIVDPVMAVRVSIGSGTNESGYNRVMNRLDVLAPTGVFGGALPRPNGVPQLTSPRSVYQGFVSVGLSPEAALKIMNGFSWFSRQFSSRFGVLERAGGARSGRDIMLTQRALARAELTGQQGTSLSDLTAGDNTSGQASIGQLAFEIRGKVQQAGRLLGLSGPQAVSDYFYAVAAAQRNAVMAKTKGERGGVSKDGDYSKFSFFVDANGNIASEQDARKDERTLNPGYKKVTGPDAPTKYKAQLQLQLGQTEAGRAALELINEGIESLKAANIRIANIRLANGVIGTAEHAAEVAQSLYLPMREVDSLGAYAPGADGRRSKATDPLSQWMVVSQNKVDAAAYTGALRDIAEQLRMEPNPAFATLGAYDVEPAAQPTDADIEADPYALIRQDWVGIDSFKLWLPNDTGGTSQVQMTINDKNVLAALKPATPSDSTSKEVAEAVMASTAALQRAWAASKLANPAFWLKTVALDSLLPLASYQGSFYPGQQFTPSMMLDALKSVNRAIDPRNLKDAFNRSWNDAMRTPTGLSSDPVRNLYTTAGGGIGFKAVFAYNDVMQSLGTAPATGNALTRAAKNAYTKGDMAMDAVLAFANALSDSIRFAAFKTFLERQYYTANGRKAPNDTALTEWARQNPDTVADASLGSKRLLGNFEDAGQAAVMRSMIPFYNAGTAGARTSAMILGTGQGRGAIAVVAMVSMMLALDAMDDEDDKDTDGLGKYVREPDSYRALRFGDVSIPLPFELGMYAALGTTIAAAIMDANGKRQDMSEAASATVSAAIKSIVPLPFMAELAEDRNPLAATGVHYVIGLLAFTDDDTWGRSRISKTAERNPTEPLWKNPRNSDTRSAVEISKAAYEVLGVNVAPGTIDLITANLPTRMPGLSGGWTQMHAEIAKANVDGRGATQGFIDWATKAYGKEVDTAFKTKAEWTETEEALLGRDEAAQKAFKRADKQVDRLTRGIGPIMSEQAEIRRKSAFGPLFGEDPLQADMTRYKKLEEDKAKTQAKIGKVQTGYYDVLRAR